MYFIPRHFNECINEMAQLKDNKLRIKFKFTRSSINHCFQHKTEIETELFCDTKYKEGHYCTTRIQNYDDLFGMAPWKKIKIQRHQKCLTDFACHCPLNPRQNCDDCQAKNHAARSYENHSTSPVKMQDLFP